MTFPGWKELLIILLIVLLVFGARRLKTIGAELAGAIRAFRRTLNDGDKNYAASNRAERVKSIDTTKPPA